MEKAIGYVTFDVATTCPYCEKKLYLNQQPYTDDLANDELSAALFGFVDKPAKWTELDIEIKCCGCKKDFILHSVEY